MSECRSLHDLPESLGSQSRRRRHAGQSVVEFALCMPLLLGVVGGALDFSRVFIVELNIQSATRNTAEFIATDSTITDISAAQTRAQSLVCAEIVGTSSCTGPGRPTATVTSFAVSTTAPGATAKSPMATVTVHVDLPFDMLFPYPFMSQAGHWTMTAAYTFSVARNR